MSSISEIEEAIRNLPDADRETLESRIIARHCGLDAMSGEDSEALLASLDEAEKEIDEGLGVSADQLRQSVRTWARK
jgi:hypothetical protein